MKSEFGLYLHVEHRNPASMHKCGDIVGVVLAGGRSRRFGSDKAEALFEGDRLVDRAIALLSTQLSTIIVSTNRDLNVPVTQIADKSATFEGPLAGILAAMAWTREQDAGYSGILTIPVDVPIFPSNLVESLVDGNQGHGAIAHDGNRLQPAFGLWPLTEWRALSEAFKLGSRSLHACVKATGANTVPFRDSAGFHNINRPEDFAHFQ